jgi:hypothetical protein
MRVLRSHVGRPDRACSIRATLCRLMSMASRTAKPTLIQDWSCSKFFGRIRLRLSVSITLGPTSTYFHVA